MLKIFICLLVMCFPWIAYENPTQLRHYRPWAGDVSEVQLRQMSHEIGQCMVQSQRIFREDAWRCKSAGRIYDPCFASSHGHSNQLLCIDSPWHPEGVRLRVVNALHLNKQALLDLSTTRPWALELMNHLRCLAVDQGELVDGLPVYYRCADQSVLFGHLQRCKEEWSILQQKKDKTIETVLIQIAWF